MLACDAQTSGGLLIAVDTDKVDDMISALKIVHPQACIIGEVTSLRNRSIYSQ